MRLRLTRNRATPKASGLLSDRRSDTLLELAIVLPVFLTFLLGLFEVAYDQFLQSVLESTLAATAFQVQVGNTVGTTNGQAFIDNPAPGPNSTTPYGFCQNALAGLLNCAKLYVRVEQFNTAACSDFYDATAGALPVQNGVLQLGDYVGEQAGAGGQVGPTGCENPSSSSGGIGFCNAGPNQYILMTAIYLAPSFLEGLIPGLSYKYNGSFVHAALATNAFYTENFSVSGSQPSPC